MRNLTIAVVAVLLCAVGTVSAVTADMDDLALGATYTVGDNFITGSLPTVLVTVGDFFFSDGTPTSTGNVSVTNSGVASGAGNELWINNVNLDLNFGQTIDGLAFQYGNLGGNLNLTINGELKNINSFVDVDNQIINGVNVFVVDNGNGQGALLAIGLIESFVVGGQELAIDNLVANCVPEPMTLGLLGLGGLVMARRRKS